MKRRQIGRREFLIFLCCCSCRQHSRPSSVIHLAPIQSYHLGLNPDRLHRVLIIKEHREGISYFSARSLVCTHQTCLLETKPKDSSLRCPCHGSVFNLDGQVLLGPATEPLPRYLLSLTNDRRLSIDLGQLVSPEWRLELNLS